MEKWVVAAKKADFKQIGIDFGIDPVIARLIRNRDIIGNDNIKLYLYGGIEDLPSPWRMKGMEEAVALLTKVIGEGKKIRIIGDYDIDGVCATYILKKGLDRVGALVDMSLPDRIVDGYGLHERMVREAAEDGIDLILTCDNGISAREEIRLAKELGMKVLVTDHHDIPFEKEGEVKKTLLPEADVILNPKQEDDSYPFDNICGAVVAWKLIWALFEKKGLAKEEALSFLDMAAFATIGDVMPLVGENRIIVRLGLPALTGSANPGLCALKEKSALTDKEITPYHVGFVLGPCINAAGRLSTAQKALDLLLTEDKEEAEALAQELHDLNAERKEMTEKGTEEAIQMVMDSTSLRLSMVLVLFLPEVHESLAGLIAGRVREKFHRPTFVLTRAESGGLKGSGRSIDAYSMYEELVGASDLLTAFGGHPLAAGLSLPEENLEAFRDRMNARCRLTKDDLVEKITVDAAMPMAYVSKRLVGQMDLLAPFGTGNPRPLFAQKDLRVVDSRVVGRNRNVLRMRLTDGNGVSMGAVYFGDEAEHFFEEIHKKDKVAVTYYPDINVYQGRETLQLVVQNVKVY